MAKAKKAGKAASRKAAAARNQMLVVASKVRQYVRSMDVNMSGEVVPALNEVVHSLLEKAVNRAKENKRKTLRPQDL